MAGGDESSDYNTKVESSATSSYDNNDIDNDDNDNGNGSG